MKNVKKLMEAYSKLGEEIREIINKQYKEDSIYLCIEDDTVYVTRVNYTTNDSKIYMDVLILLKTFLIQFV